MHPLYKKRFAVEKKYYVHNTLVANEWDTVKIRQTRPISKLKRRIVTEVVSTAI
jgi:small subunit ribosomal protein S17